MSRSLRILASLLIAIALVIVGCAKPEAKYVGTYSGKQVLSQAGLDMVNKSPNAAQIKASMDSAQVSLSLNKDKTATMSLGGKGIPASTVSGTWALTNDKVVLTLKQPGGADAGQPMELTPAGDGKTLTAGGSQYGSMTFTKS